MFFPIFFLLAAKHTQRLLHLRNYLSFQLSEFFLHHVERYKKSKLNKKYKITIIEIKIIKNTIQQACCVLNKHHAFDTKPTAQHALIKDKIHIH